MSRTDPGPQVPWVNLEDAFRSRVTVHADVEPMTRGLRQMATAMSALGTVFSRIDPHTFVTGWSVYDSATDPGYRAVRRQRRANRRRLQAMLREARRVQ